MKVAIGIDGSELSYQAVRFTSKLLSPRVDDLLLFFSPPEFHLASKTPLPDEVLKSAAWALAAGVFDNAVNCLSPEMQDITSTMRSDRLPADGLVELAEKEDVDLVVVGSVSAKRKFPYLLGSTARSIIHNTDKPVLVVRGEKAVAKGAMKVLVACDRDRWVDATGDIQMVNRMNFCTVPMMAIGSRCRSMACLYSSTICTELGTRELPCSSSDSTNLSP